MRVVFISNYLNHHQLPFCLQLENILGKDFKFISTNPISEERLRLGYVDMSESYEFLINSYSSDENYFKSLKLAFKSEIVIIGNAPYDFVKERIKSNKITFFYNERLFKKGKLRLLWPKTLFKLYTKHIAHKNKNTYMLCPGIYAAEDFKFIGAYKDKLLKWGYFPECKSNNIEKILKKKENAVPKILWVGRFISWKHPEQAIELAKMLKKYGYTFKLNLIGKGQLETSLRSLIKKYELERYVEILGNKNLTQVRENMEESNIFLATSDFNEGWGAVLNESMSSGCAVVASKAMGSASYLVNHRNNGLVYKNKRVGDLFMCVKSLLDDRELTKELGIKAYDTILKTWNAEVSAKRLLLLAESYLKNKTIKFEEGPLSDALKDM